MNGLNCADVSLNNIHPSSRQKYLCFLNEDFMRCTERESEHVFVRVRVSACVLL